MLLCRSGTNHKFKSTEAAFTVGGRIQEKFKWTAKMKNYDIEVFLVLFASYLNGLSREIEKGCGCHGCLDLYVERCLWRFIYYFLRFSVKLLVK
jgi:hypothetical protein